MMSYNIQTICDAVGGELMAGNPSVLVTAGVSTDTRSIAAGALFVALAGERFDAHDYLAQAVGSGAAGMVVSRLPEGCDPGETCVIRVKDTLRALQRLARWYRDELGIPVVGITGSNGKTTTKDFIASVLRQRFTVNATRGNLNNHIGLPLTVLDTAEDDELCVLEMGMNHSGEIALLCEIARPHIGVITNIGTAHIEFMGSREAIAEEKSALARSLPEVGTLLVQAGCDFADYFHERTLAHTVTVGNGRGMVRAEELTFAAAGASFQLVVDGKGRVPVRVPLVGRHMVSNALLAAGVGVALGLTLEEIARGLERAELTGGRLKRFQSGGITVFDDTYNANPESVKAAVEALAEQPTENGACKMVVLGLMAELGRFAGEMHREVGRHAAEHGVRVVSVGEGAVEIAKGAEAVGKAETRHFDDYEKAMGWVKEALHPGDFVLFKGSRLAAVETIMNKAFPRD